MTVVSNTPLALPPQYRDLQPAFNKLQRDIIAAVEGKAVTAQTAADAAQGDATLSLEQVQALSEQNARDVKKINFLRQWYGS